MQREFQINPLLINHQPQPGKNSWVKTFIYEPAETEVLQSRGTMYAVLSVSAKSNFDFAGIMQMILEQLQNQYFQQPSGGILQTLEAALDGIHRKIILMGQKDKKFAEEFNFNLLTAVSWGTVLYFGQLGPSRAALYRDGKLFDIDEGEQKSTNLYMSSGVLRTNDKIILGTSQLFKLFNKTALKQILSKPDDQIVSAIEAKLDSGTSRQVQSGIVLSVDIKQVPSVEEEAIAIKDPSTMPIGQGKQGWLSRLNPLSIFRAIAKPFTWRLFGVVPVLPVLIILIAGGVLVYSLIGGQILESQPDLNQAIVTSATDSLDQAEQVVEINPDRAYDLLQDAQEYIQQGLQTHPDHAQLASLQDRHDQILQRILVSSSLAPVSLANVNISPTQPKMSVSGENLYAIDGQHQSIISVDTNSGSVDTVLTQEAISPQSLLSATNAGLMFTASDGIIPVIDFASVGDKATFPNPSPVIASAQFDVNGYVLTQDGRVYRIPRTETEIGQLSSYFNQPISNTGLTDMAVDGFVYILRQDGAVEQYFNGAKQSLVLERSNLAEGAKAIFAPLEGDNLYIFGNNALLAWTKTGEYIGQYQLDGIGEWQMAGVNEVGDTLYVLAEGKLYRATLP